MSGCVVGTSTPAGIHLTAVSVTVTAVVDLLEVVGTPIKYHLILFILGKIIFSPTLKVIDA